MEGCNDTTACVTGGTGYIGSLLVKKLLQKGYTVHATLRNLEDKVKVDFLRSLLPDKNSKLKLFQADIYRPEEFEAAISGCAFVFHVATPMQHNPESTQYKDRFEACIAGVRSIADSCIRSKTVKRLIYTGSVMAASPLNEDGTSFKPCLDESCWTPLNHSFLHWETDFTMEYTKAKTIAEKEILGYNERWDVTKLQVVSLACGLVGGETLVSSASGSLKALLSQITGFQFGYNHGLLLLQEILGSIPLVHIDDVCEAHIYCMENSEKITPPGRYLCAFDNPTIKEIAAYFEKNHPEFKIDEFKGEPEEQRKTRLDSSKLNKTGFKYQYDLKKILEESLESGKRLGLISNPSN